MCPHELSAADRPRGGKTIFYTVIIPTLNAGPQLGKLLDVLSTQTIPPDEILVVDSASDDGTPALAAEHSGVRLIQISRQDFDHGGTRDMAFRACQSPFVVFMTQDALPTGNRCMETLLAPFEDERVAAVCARQIARPDARASEKAVREFRYPDSSEEWGKEDLPRLGIRSYLLSDACSAYRRTAYEAVGGFEHPIVADEDMLIAADFLDAGYRLVYQADTCVWHSHRYTFRQEYRRNYSIGQFLARYGHRFDEAEEMSEGLRMVGYVTKKLLRQGKMGETMAFWWSCVARYLGNRAGKRREKRQEWSGRNQLKY